MMIKTLPAKTVGTGRKSVQPPENSVFSETLKKKVAPQPGTKELKKSETTASASHEDKQSKPETPFDAPLFALIPPQAATDEKLKSPVSQQAKEAALQVQPDAVNVPAATLSASGAYTSSGTSDGSIDTNMAGRLPGLKMPQPATKDMPSTDKDLLPAAKDDGLNTPDVSAQLAEPAAQSQPQPQVHTVSTDSLVDIAGLTSFSAQGKESQPPAPVVATGVLMHEPGTSAWQQSLGQQIACFTRDGVHHAELRLHPEELGSLQISLRLNNDQAQLHFVTENHQVRAALESAMPELRTSLAESGINLGQSSVGADSTSGGASYFEKRTGHTAGEEESGEVTLLSTDGQRTSGRNINYLNGISTFA